MLCSALSVDTVVQACILCSGMKNKVFERVVTLSDYMAPKATAVIIHHLPTVHYLIYQVI